MSGLRLVLALALVAYAAAKSTEKNTYPYGKYDYEDVLHKSMLFYEAQRSGPLPEDRRIRWREDSAMDDQGENGEDLTGGWYDAGDHVKFGFPQAGTVTMLAWGINQFRSGYQVAGELHWGLDTIKWPLDYFMKAHVSDNEFYIQVAEGATDHKFWGRAEDMTMERLTWKLSPEKPGSDAAGETAAALAAGAIAFRDTDIDYSARLLDHARRLYNFADTYRGFYSEHTPGDYYGSVNYNDELCWGAMWLYEATGDDEYLAKAELLLPESVDQIFSWEDKMIGCVVLHYKHTQSPRTKAMVEKYVKEWLPGGKYIYTPKGLAWAEKWGVNRHASNGAMVALVAADLGLMVEEGRKFALSQINYILGDNGRSYVCGFGHNPPDRPHHRTASCNPIPAKCDWDDYYKEGPNGIVLVGALVGGPDENDYYEDDRADFVKNEVATDYNSGFQSSLAGIIQWQYEEKMKKNIQFA